MRSSAHAASGHGYGGHGEAAGYELGFGAHGSPRSSFIFLPAPASALTASLLQLSFPRPNGYEAHMDNGDDNTHWPMQRTTT